MGKRLFSLLTALVMALSFSVAVNADGGLYSSHGILLDERDILTSDEEEKLSDLLSSTASEIEMNVMVYFPSTISSSEQKTCLDLLDDYFNPSADSIVLMLPKEGSGFDDWIAYTNGAKTAFQGQLDHLWDAVYYGLDSGESVNYPQAIVQFCNYLIKNRDGYVGEVKGSSFYKVRLEDYQGELSQDEYDSLYGEMQDKADEIGANIGVVLTNGVGSGNEQKYTDDFLDENFGAESSSIVLMLVRAGTGEQDWISCTQHAYDNYGRKIDRIFDAVYDGLAYNGGDNYPAAIRNFLSFLSGEKLPYAGANYSGNYIDDYDDNSGKSFMNFGTGVLGGLIVALIITIVVVKAVSGSYKKKAPISARAYIDTNMTHFTERRDMFVREYTTSHRVSSSSSGGGGSHRSGGGGGHSRSGSRGGGGGRRR